MSNVAHASLTGSQLHEPKGIDTAALGTVYVANGAASGSWSSVGTSSFTGAIADFVTVEAPTGWLELDGSTISTSTFSALYAVLAKQTSGTRTNGSPIITSIADTSKFKIGYFVFGTGLTSGSIILSVDSGTQITISNNATSSGSAAFAVSPCTMNTGTITLPDLTTAGRFRRSRTSATVIGQVQADQNQAHTHSLSVTGTTDSQGSHTHSITDPGHTHGANEGSSPSASLSALLQASTGGIGSTGGVIPAASTGISINSAGAHTHSVTSTGTSSSTGSTETRPLNYIVMTCIKT